MSPTRYSVLGYSIICCFLIVSTRLFYWQIIKTRNSRDKVFTQTYKLEKINPIRGKIYTSDNFPLVQNQSRYLLSIYKPNLNSPLSQIFDQISQVSPDFITLHQDLITKFSSDDQQKWLTFPYLFTHNQADLLNLPGLSFQPSSSRFYPENTMASSILGYVAKDANSKDVGYLGLEGYYQKQLEGKPGFYRQVKDATGNPILSSQNWQSTVIDGRNLYTTINREIQFLAETQLRQGIDQYQAESGSIVIMEPRSGAILAMAANNSSPSATHNRNQIIFDQYEPGSIFKPLVVASALDNGSITTNFVCNRCNRPRVIDQYTVNNWNSEFHPDSSLQDIIKNSDNIGMSYIIDQLGLKNFLHYYQLLGLTTKTGIDLEGESAPPVKDYWSQIDLATASFGQGIALTQIQMLQAFNSLANDGLLVHPYVVDHLSQNLNIIKTRHLTPKRVFSTATVKQVKDILDYSVNNGVVAKFKPSGLSVCAKSGTAQVAVQGGYTNDQTIASYIGFSPCINPKFTMLITINNPKTSPWGASTAAPIWFNIASRLYYFL